MHIIFYCLFQILVNFGQAEDNASFVFLKDLQRRKAKMDDVIQCLKKIKCYKAVCLLEGRPGEWEVVCECRLQKLKKIFFFVYKLRLASAAS